jgi:predicted Rossmann-fold nucleotide-binding protein
VITWAQLGIHNKPIGVLNANGFYDPLLKLVENGFTEGLIGKDMSNVLVVSSDPKELLDKMEKHVPPQSSLKWVTEAQV